MVIRPMRRLVLSLFEREDVAELAQYFAQVGLFRWGELLGWRVGVRAQYLVDLPQGDDV